MSDPGMSVKPNTCAHEQYEPVEVRDPLDAGQGAVTVIANVCTRCLDRLPAAWGCTDCEWYEERRVMDPVPYQILALRCPAHRDS